MTGADDEPADGSRSSKSAPAPPQAPAGPGGAWVFESLVGAVPGVTLSPGRAVGAQFLAFGLLVVGLAATYDRPDAALAGLAVVGVAAAGSAAMLAIATTVREGPGGQRYRRLLFGSSIEVSLGVLAFVAFLTVVQTRPPTGDGPLAATLGPGTPAPIVFLALLVVFDCCYRIGTGWWASVVSLYRSARYPIDPDAVGAYRRADLTTAGFGCLQLGLLPLVLHRPILAVAVGGHVAAVLLVTAASLVVLTVRTRRGTLGA